MRTQLLSFFSAVSICIALSKQKYIFVGLNIDRNYTPVAVEVVAKKRKIMLPPIPGADTRTTGTTSYVGKMGGETFAAAAILEDREPVRSTKSPSLSFGLLYHTYLLVHSASSSNMPLTCMID